MAELNEHEVAGGEGGGDDLEMAFDGVGAGGAAGYGELMTGILRE